ncbi:hypothetical protein KP509_01G126700 [Ceratopteris richardii]|nr:hypothetical protein KP509_01G126700 [Ceratopteris richardii]
MEEVTLSRTMGSEKIEIICMLEKQYPWDEDEPEEQRLQHRHHHQYNKHKNIMHEEDLEIIEVLHMSVSLSKTANVRLEVDCSFVRGAKAVMIEDVIFHEDDILELEGAPEPYGGPIFEDLDEDLQQGFHEILEVRGLTAKFAWYMMDYMTDKEQREYVRWLHRVRDFLSN